MLEVIATTLDDAINIEHSGANRIELVSALTEGGLTPSYALIKQVVKSVSIPVNIMIRPHSKSFIYTENDVKTMKEDIEIARSLKANGVVFGALTKDMEIDEEVLDKLLASVGDLEVTFHRAIDASADPVKATKVLKNYTKITRILTSGGQGKIDNNFKTINEMIKTAGPIILLGGGITLHNIPHLRENTGAKEFHVGTAVRKNHLCLSEIDEASIKKILAKIC